MAKKNAAPTPTPRFEAVGWTFFLVLTLVLSAPFIFLAWVISYENTEWYLRVGIGLTFAGFAAAILTWIINSALQYRVERIKQSQRQRSKKRK
jgi:hypothetical protein